MPSSHVPVRESELDASADKAVCDPENLAVQLAERHAVSRRPKWRPALLERLQMQETVLRRAYARFAELSDSQHVVSYAAEWMLDNFYVVQQTLRQVREDMPESYYRQLPQLKSGYPRVFSLAQEVIKCCDAHLDLEWTSRFVRAYQRVSRLTMGELWALPTMLRLGVLAYLADAAARVSELREQKEEDDSSLVSSMAPGRPPWCTQPSKDLQTALSLAPHLTDEEVVANCVLSLRTLAVRDWKKFFESVSQVETVLRRDPAGVYARMDFDTRDRYRDVVEELAQATGRGEEEVAQEALRLAQGAYEPSMFREHIGVGYRDHSSRTAHVGFYLVGAGRAELEARLGYHPRPHARLQRWLLHHPSPVYLGSIALLSLVVVLGLLGYVLFSGGTVGQLIGVLLLAPSPALAVAVGLVNWLITHGVSPRVLPKMDFRDGVPAEHSTMVVVPALVTDIREIRFVLHQVELHFLGNEDPHIRFALLVDFADAPHEHMPGDDELLERIKAGVLALNRKYGSHRADPFYLFYRPREWNEAEDCWMGWERKRGKLVQFNRLLKGRDTSYEVRFGDLDFLRQVRYVITLDADTTLPRDSARRLIATLAHPLNWAEFDAESDTVVAGYTVLQPRVEIKPTSAGRSLFARIFSGDTGLDLYTRAVSDVYHDFFGEGIYAGKGIYDVEAFEHSLDGRVPDNSLLSHDLFEGIHGRAGLVSDVILYEDYPAHYLAYTRRLHRWVRGDWQLLPWLLSRVPAAGGGRISSNLSVIDRWKLFDNLRRSLLKPALMALLLAGWFWLPGSPLVWTLAGVMALALPIITGAFIALMRGLRGTASTGALPAVWMGVARWLLALIFLPYESLIIVDAVAATLHRLFITRKRLLQWTTAAHTIRLFGKESKVGLLWRKMGVVSILAMVLTWLVLTLRPEALPAAIGLLFVWVESPVAAYWISQPFTRKQTSLSSGQRQQLRCLARRTWLYFEQFVGPDDHWLPPDHFQEDPRGLVARRTSPTNIGLLLLSTLSAYDLGYIGPMNLALRLRATFEGMEQLRRYRGHFLNWYETRSLKPLPPLYVSTVDSGNLAGCLVALRQGLLALQHEPVLRWQRWQGLVDAISVLAGIVEGLEGRGLDTAVEALEAHLTRVRRRVLAVRDRPGDWASLLDELSGDLWREQDRLLIALVESGSHVLDAVTLRDLRVWSERIRHQLLNMKNDLNMLVPWSSFLSQPPALFTQPDGDPALVQAWRALVDALPATPRLAQIAEICKAGQVPLTELRGRLIHENAPAEQMQEARVWCEDLAEEMARARMVAESSLIGYQDLGEQAEAYLQAMGFDFLFDPQRQVFHLGFDLAAGKLDANHYDLLASEARITSLVAIAKGDVPQSHWLHLARPVSRVDGTRALLSWNGSMFEYLMPSLLMRSYEETLLHQTSRAVVRRQISYARQQGVPWGISESGYYAFDANMNYQYRGFGVPRLGFKRGLGDDLVISPYASLLALSLDPQAVMRNVDRLTKRQMLGRYGFYEAIDYTRSRLSLGQECGTVRSYMAHHQGMVLLSLVNYLADGTMIDRFHVDPRVESVALLLQEQVPYETPVEVPHPEEAGVLPPVQTRPTLEPWEVPVDGPPPHVHFLSNGRYGLLITSAGGGYSRWNEVALTRWRADTTLDNWGTWLYIQDQDSGDLWSASHWPTASPPEDQQVLFSPYQAEFRRRDHDISLRMDVTVSPMDDVEIRRVTLINHSDRSRRVMLTSYGEVVLASQAADRRHPAFNKLFIENEVLPEIGGLLFHRRSRSDEESPFYLAHFVVVEGDQEITGAYESDRARFLGRGRTPRSPAALDKEAVPQWPAASSEVQEGAPQWPAASSEVQEGASQWTVPSSGAHKGEGLSGTAGATLDPIMAVGQRIVLEPHGTSRLAYMTLAAESRQEAMDVARRYRDWSLIDQAFDRARADSELELHQLDLAAPDIERIQQLLALLLYPHRALRADPATLVRNRKGQSGLWSYAISGDYPILLVRVNSQEETALARELLRAHAYWRNRQIMVDLVILNQHDTGYSQELHNHLHRLVARMGGDAWLNRRGGIFLLRAALMGESDLVLLATAARVVLDGGLGSLSEQLTGLRQRPPRLPQFVPTLSRTEGQERTPPLVRPGNLLFDNGWGGFSEDGREYLIYLEPGQRTPAPWVNVIANPDFGFLVSESGLGFTWAENSGENKLTPWRNDPVTDAPSEAIYLRDEESGHVWSPTPLPAGARSPYLIRHGMGYSVFEHNSHGIKQRLRIFAAPDGPVKMMRLRLENTSERNRRLTVTFYAEWVLGPDRDVHQQYVVPEFDAVSNVLLAHNPYNEEFGGRVAFLAADKEPHGLTADRAEFLGHGGLLGRPAALDRVGLATAVCPGLDPCAVLQVHIWLAPGEVEEAVFLLGQGADRQQALRLVKRYRDPAQVGAAWEAVGDLWDGLLGTVTVRTPDPAMDVLLNNWLLYQALSCRIWGRSALYQSSGAFGYRDQLQDVMALIHAAPELVREHILRAAQHQFEAGDVLHWWHPPSGRGVRTRCSDDLLWLPFVTAHYVATTGDEAILDEQVPFLMGDPLEPDEMERYGRYASTAERYTLYEHCRRAVERGTTSGVHGIPLIGSHDWNDGLNRVGTEGRGESVWLGWFLYAILDRFAPFCERMGDEEEAAAYRERARKLRRALEEHAWDGSWYRRAYYDDGTPLGSSESEEARIDSLAQSWAVLSGAAEPGRATRAMEAVDRQLVRPDDDLILLFTPPFDRTKRDPGYIKGYPPGIRENGGQYTHAATWAVWAFAELGRGDQAEALFRVLNPIYHSDAPGKVARYRVEPYVVAADVYSVEPHVGRGGWTWYTGSAGWMYRLGIEGLLGLRREGETLRIDPCIPKDWSGYELTYRDGGTSYRIRVENPDRVNQGVERVTLDGEALSGGDVPLLGDGQEHHVRVLMG